MKYSRTTQRDLKKLPQVPIPRSTFLTLAGPARGTLWFDVSNPSQPFSPVSMVEDCGGLLFVKFEDESNNPVHLRAFFDRVASGRYMLVGVKTHPSYHVVTP